MLAALENACRSFAGLPAVVDRGRILDYGAFWHRIEEVAAILGRSVLGTRCLLIPRNTVESLTVFYGLLTPERPPIWRTPTGR